MIRQRTVLEGAEGLDYNIYCPICGKKRGKHCQEKSFFECPNKKEECKNKDSSNIRACKGYSAGYVGLGSHLGTNILRATYNIPKEAKSPTVDSLKERLKNKTQGEVIDKGSHPMYVGQNSIQAHHLICSEFMNDEDDKWRSICKITRYNVNCKLNGKFLPADMQLACFLKMQRHAGSHYMGGSLVEHENQQYIMSYVNGVESELNIILKTFSNKPCDAGSADSLIEKMNDLSKKICERIRKFEWTIAWDASNYHPKAQPRIGCANTTSIPKKKEKFFNVHEKKLKEEQLISKSLTDAQKWKSNAFDDMDTIQQLVEENQGDICCTSFKAHYEKYGKIITGKTKKHKFEVGY